MSENRRLIEIIHDIDHNESLRFAEKLLTLNEISNEPIDLLIDSDGGDAIAMLAIVELMRLSPAPIRTICVGKARSAAAVILSCGTAGRYALPHSSILLHGTRYDRNNEKHHKADTPPFDIFMEDFAFTNKRIHQILAQQTKKSEIEIERACSYDNFMYGEDALAFGLIDGFVKDPAMLKTTEYDFYYGE